MALRFIEVFLPTVARARADMILEPYTVLDRWHDQLSDRKMCIKILISSEETQDIVDHLEKEFCLVDDFRIIIFPVEATIPRPSSEKSCGPGKSDTEKPKKKETWLPTISREELYDDISGTITFSWMFMVMVILSTVVAAVGIINDNVAVIIGAMVIAPLLGPNAALCLGTTLGDVELTKRATKLTFVGISLALFFSVVLGVIIDVNTKGPELAARTEVGYGDIALALAAGAAAALSFTTKAYSTLIGVMVAVALLPPIVVLGLLLGEAEWELARGAFLLLIINIIGINLSGVLVFLAQGVRPLRWWEADKAKRASRRAILLWSILLVVLVVVVYLSQPS